MQNRDIVQYLLTNPRILENINFALVLQNSFRFRGGFLSYISENLHVVKFGNVLPIDEIYFILKLKSINDILRFAFY